MKIYKKLFFGVYSAIILYGVLSQGTPFWMKALAVFVLPINFGVYLWADRNKMEPVNDN